MTKRFFKNLVTVEEDMKDPRRPISLSSYESQSYYLWLQLLIEGFNIKYMSTLVIVPAKLKYFSEQNLEDVL